MLELKFQLELKLRSFDDDKKKRDKKLQSIEKQFKDLSEESKFVKEVRYSLYISNFK
jgi:hypothetical protein